MSKEARARLRDLSLCVSTAVLCAVPGTAQTLTQPTTAEPATGAPATPEAAPPGQGEGLQEIIVTAQKRAQNLQDVGVAVTALTGNALKLVPRNDVTQLVTSVPSLQVNQYSPSLTVFNLRGVSQNDFSDTQEAPIAYYNDEVYIGSPGAIAGQTFDLERVEVLRGPQGTLFGRNATGGLIQQVSAKPTDQLDGFITLTGGSYGQFSTEAAISGPLSDRIRGRLSFTSDNHGGYYHQLTPGIKDGGNSRFYAGRAQLEADVGSGGKLRVKVEYLRNDHESSNALTGIAVRQNDDGLGVAFSPNENYYGTGAGNNYFGFRPSSSPFVSQFNRAGNFNRKYLNTLVRYEQDLGWATLTSITAYQNLHKQYAEDTDGEPYDALNVASRQKLYQLSQELRLSGKTDRLTWLVGVYGLKIRTRNTAGGFVDPALYEFNPSLIGLDQVFGLPPGVSLPVGTLASDSFYQVRQNTRSLAVFGQAEYKLSDVFTAVVGARYSSDWKRFDYIHRSLADPSTGFYDPDGQYLVDYDFSSDGSKRFQNWSGKVELDARPARGTLLYVSANRGTKSGGFNNPVVINANDPLFGSRFPFKQEVLTNYEGGFKLSLANNRVTFNSAAFHYVYKNYQAFQDLSGAQFITNLPARVTGVEAEIAARPMRQLNVSAFATRLFQAQVRDVTLPGLDDSGTGRTVNNRMPEAPRWSLGGSLAYDIAVGDDAAVTLSTNWKYNTTQYFSIFNAPVERQKPYAVGNLRASFAPRSQLYEIAFFVNNVTDKYYKVFVSDNSFTTTAEDVFARPRWFGGSLTYRFGK